MLQQSKNGEEGWGGGNDCENTEAPMNYSGWHLTAAVPRAGAAVPGPVVAGMSVPHGSLQTLQTTARPVGVWSTTSKKKSQYGSLTYGLVLILCWLSEA